MSNSLAKEMKTLSLKPGESKDCGLCGKSIEGEFADLEGVAVHQDCFKCGGCKADLAGGDYYENEKKYYCKPCYVEAVNPKCAHCEKTIEGEYIVALNQKWHSDHFICHGCTSQFKDGSFRVKGRTPYCQTCFDELKDVCEGCGRGFTESEVVKAGSKLFHKDCFVCRDGDHKITSGGFNIKAGKVFCAEHYKKRFGKTCAGCKQKFVGKSATVGGQTFCFKCLTCSDCSGKLTGKFGKVDGKFVCGTCVTKYQ